MKCLCKAGYILYFIMPMKAEMQKLSNQEMERRAEEMAQLIGYLLRKYEELSFISRTHMKSQA